MRRRTRNLVLALFAALVVLLLLGALPSFLASGDPYYVTATSLGPVADGNLSGADANASGAVTDEPPPAVNGTALPPRRFPYTTDALERATEDAAGRSNLYWRGYVGLKEAFTHSPFDELDGIRGRNTEAALDGDRVRVAYNETYYAVEIVREDGGS